MLLQNFLNTWCDHEIADSAQPRYRSIVTRPFSLFVRAGSGHETNKLIDMILHNAHVSVMYYLRVFIGAEFEFGDVFFCFDS